jgi:hypothetical protein
VLVDLHVVRAETEVVEDNPQFGKLADDLGQQRQLVRGQVGPQQQALLGEVAQNRQRGGVCHWLPGLA